MFALVAVFQLELRLQWRRRERWLLPIGFYILVALLFVLGSAPSPELLRTLGPTIIWVAALLSILMVVEPLFNEDLHDGTIDLFITSQQSLALIILAKLLAVILVTVLPLLLVAPLLVLMFGMAFDHLGVVLLTIALVIPSLILIGAIGSALISSLANSSALLTLIILPFYIPVLIFATRAIQSAMLGLSFAAELYFLAAILVLSITLAPVAASAALKLSNS